MSFFSSVGDFLSGAAGGDVIKLGAKVVNKFMKQFPDKLSEKERAELEIIIADAEHTRNIELLQLAKAQDEQFNNRIRDLEGTAKDLSQFGMIGRILILLRGTQRPLWGFSVLIMDYKVFSGDWVLSDPLLTRTVATSMTQESAFWIINFLVLGFLFGERAIRNIMPMVQAFTTKR